MTDRIELRGLRLMARCGVLPFERDQDQPVELDLDIAVDLAAAGASDDLADTVDYGAVCDTIAAAVTASPTNLLEAMAERVAQSVLGFDVRVAEVDVRLRKLRPPVAQQLASSGVRLVRGR